MPLVYDHDHKFRLIAIGSEFRERCTICSAVRLVPNPGDSDHELIESIETGVRHERTLSDGEWTDLVARMLQRSYERETGLPAFAGSIEYINWLQNRSSNV